MQQRSGWHLVWCVVGTAILFGQPARRITAEDGVAAGLRQMLEAGTASTVAARQAADERFRLLEQAKPGDWRIEYAYLLVKINQGQYKDAERLAKELSAREPSDLNILQARVWLASILRDYAGSLAQLERLGEQLAAAESVDEETTQRLARFMGRVVAFLEGPASASTNARLLANATQKILERLDEPARLVFDDAREAVTDQYLALTETKEERAQRAERETQEAREATLRGLAEQRERIGERRDDLVDQRSRLQKELTDQLNATARADVPLATQLARLQSQGAFLSGDLASIQFELSRLERLIISEQDPFLRDSYIRESERLRLVGRRYAFDLANVERQANVVVAQRLELQRQRAEIERTVGGQLGAATQEMSDLQQREKRSEGLERRALRTRPASAQNRALSAQAAAFTTYEPFPYDQQRRWILTLFP